MKRSNDGIRLTRLLKNRNSHLQYSPSIYGSVRIKIGGMVANWDVFMLRIKISMIRYCIVYWNLIMVCSILMNGREC